MEEVSFFRLPNCFRLPLLHIVTDDVIALPSLHQWFPITLRIISKLSPWPNLSPDLISFSWSSHWGRLAISGTHQACSYFRDFTLFLLPGVFCPPQPYMAVSSTTGRSQVKCALSSGAPANPPPLWKRASWLHFIPDSALVYVQHLWLTDFLCCLLLPLKQKLYRGRDLVVSIVVFLVLRTIPGT